MTPNLPGGCKTTDEFAQYLVNKVRECITYLHKNKEETVIHLWKNYKIDPEETRLGWDHREEHGILYNAYRENLEKIRKKLETENKTGEEEADSSTDQKAKETSLNVEAKELRQSTKVVIDFVKPRIEERLSAYYSKEDAEKHLQDNFQIEHVLTRTIWDQLEIENPEFFSSYYKELDRRHGLMHSKDPEQVTESDSDASSQQAETEDDGILEQILTSMTKIERTSEQMLKVMTDAAKSREKQQVEQKQVRGDNEEIGT